MTASGHEPLRPVLLVVDDEPGIIVIVERVARASGFDVVSRTGAETAKKLATINADAALVDLRIPGSSGLDILQAIRTHDPACQVILMTGFASLDSAVEAVKLGALEYLSKPLDLDRLRELLKTVLNTLDRRRRLMEADGAAHQDGADHGRDRNRQGTGRRGPAPDGSQAEPPLRDAQLLGCRRTAV